MNHWIIAPVILPAMLAPLIGFVMRHDISLARAASVTGTILLFAISVGLLILATSGETHVYKLGDWDAPYGIVLVLDRLSALMVFLTSLLALIVLIHAVATGWDNRGRHFHALFQFQLMGICGAFLTGDVFNLFVFFEVLLIASYGLMIHSGGKARLQAGLQYVVINLAGSTLFLFALGTLYATTGTLNIAHLAVRLAEIPVEDAALVRVATMLLMIVFAVKAALFPVQFWLPGTYANAPAPVAALFAIMTKVGAYAIIRVYTLIFGPDVAVTEGLFGVWLMPLALVSLTVGMVGVLAARQLDRMLAYSVIGSMGMVMVSISLFTPEGIAAALYYIVHSTLAAGALFLISDLARAGRANLNLSAQPPLAGAPLTSALFFVAAIAMAGLPPLSGFVGKLLILDAGFDSDWVVWIWAVVLGTSLISVVGFSRAGSVVFWKARSFAVGAEREDPEDTKSAENAKAEAQGGARHPSFLSYAAVCGLLALLVAHTVLAGPVVRYTQAVAAQLFDPAPYVSTVLDTQGKLTRPMADGAYGAEDHEADAYGADDHGDAATTQEGH